VPEVYQVHRLGPVKRGMMCLFGGVPLVAIRCRVVF
jgi:hypothetical protein